MSIYLKIYLWLSEAAMLAVFLELAWEDYDRVIRKNPKRSNEKFPPHYKSWGVSLAMIISAGPVFNVLMLILILKYYYWVYFLKEKEEKALAELRARATRFKKVK